MSADSVRPRWGPNNTSDGRERSVALHAENAQNTVTYHDCGFRVNDMNVPGEDRDVGAWLLLLFPAWLAVLTSQQAA